MSDRASQHRAHQRNRDRSKVLLTIGIALLMPPLAGIFSLDTKLAGVPATLVYLFGVWALLIVATVLLSSRLRKSDGAAEPER